MPSAPDPDRSSATHDDARHVVIVGGGFGGLACAQALAASAQVGGTRRVTLIDRQNHHLFQPLLYQVSTAALSPADIAAPLRHILRKAANVEVRLGEVCGIDEASRCVRLADGDAVPYDVLVLATGSVYDYFGHADWAARAPGPKTIGDARAIRSRLLGAFERAEACADPARRAALMTFVVVGGGPTGVEMAGTVAELARSTLRGDFRRIDPAEARVVLVEAGPRLLATFPAALGDYAAHALGRLGVELRLGTRVEAIEPGRVRLGDDWLAVGAVVWGAGTRAAAGAEWLGLDGAGHDQPGLAKGGRIAVTPTLAVPGHPDVYALGDLAHLEQDGVPLPGLAQVAQQQGRHLGRALCGDAPPPRFRYRSRGDVAVIGRHAAVFSLGRLRLKGWPAWCLWAVVHVVLLVGFEQRLLVTVQWLWLYLTGARGARLIDRPDA